MRNKFLKVNFPKVTVLLVSIVCRIIISKLSYVEPNTGTKHSSLLSNSKFVQPKKSTFIFIAVRKSQRSIVS